MTSERNILFIMCDQLRQDYLSCYGHPVLETPNIDSLAERGVRFTNAYCQAPICAASRASFYTGRYMSSHGVMGNGDNTDVGEKMLADYLRPQGYRTAVIGKTHSFKSRKEMRDLDIDESSTHYQYSNCGGFEPYEHHEGLYPDPIPRNNHGYTNYLKSLGYTEDNPWNSRANSGIDEFDNLHSGWQLRSSRFPAAIKSEHSETAFTTRRAIEFIKETGDQPWCLHLSYIKPHWPLIAPAPYHSHYSINDIKPVVRSENEREQPHPVMHAFMQAEYSESWSQEEVREVAIPAYMGLVKEIDDQLGTLFEFMKTKALFDNTLIVFTSDHGDYLGDHWLGEKDLFHEPSVKIPYIVVDPTRAADKTRGLSRAEFVESVDVIPSMIEFVGENQCDERQEGRPLQQLLHETGPAEGWREFTVSEIDYSDRGVRQTLGLEPYQCRATMIRDRRWKFVHYHGFEAQLFDLDKDPDELVNLASESNLHNVRASMMTKILRWRESLKSRTGISYANAVAQTPLKDEASGIIIGRW